MKSFFAILVAALCIGFFPQHQSTSTPEVFIKPAVDIVPDKTTLVVVEQPKKKTTFKQRLGDTIVARTGQSSRTQIRCALEIVYRESRYDKKAVNPSSGATGLFQLMHGRKKWTVDKQVHMATKYMKHRYGTWCNALEHHNDKGWW
jgi:hypothetical protein